MLRRDAKIRMMVHNLLFCLLVVLLFSACSPSPSEDDPVLLPDPCAPENIHMTIKPLDMLMGAFEDTTAVAYKMPRQMVADQITVLQEIRRDVSDKDVSSCLNDLKRVQIEYMDSVINTLLAFLEGAPGQVTTKGLGSSWELRSRYFDELERLLGVTLTPRPTEIHWTPQVFLEPTEQITVPVETNTPIPTRTVKFTPTIFSTIAMVVNPRGANVRSGPSVLYESRLVIPTEEMVEVIGRLENGEWLLIRKPEMPEGTGWVFTELVKLESPIEQIPVVENIPPITAIP
jgi:hypothetical protein